MQHVLPLLNPTMQGHSVLAAQLDPSTAFSWSLIQSPSGSTSAWLPGCLAAWLFRCLAGKQAINQIGLEARIVLVGHSPGGTFSLDAEGLSTSLLWLRVPGMVSADVRHRV